MTYINSSCIFFPRYISMRSSIKYSELPSIADLLSTWFIKNQEENDKKIFINVVFIKFLYL